MSEILSDQETCINYDLLPSLRTMAIVKCVTCVVQNAFQNEDLLGLVSNTSIHKTLVHDIHEVIEEKLLHNFSFLNLPHVLQAECSYYIRSTMIQMIAVLGGFTSLKGIPVDSICWTVNGSIDKIKTLESWVRNNNGICDYELACDCCAEDLIKDIWKNLSENQKNDYRVSVNCFVTYWSYTIENNREELQNLNDYFNTDPDIENSIDFNMFEYSLSERNILGIKYFWQKLSFQEKAGNLLIWVLQMICTMNKCKIRKTNKCTKERDILVFLVSQMNFGNHLNGLLKVGLYILDAETLNIEIFSWSLISEMLTFSDDRYFCSILSNILQNIISLAKKLQCIIPGSVRNICGCRYLFEIKNITYCYDDYLKVANTVKNFSLEDHIKIIVHSAVREPFPTKFFSLIFNSELSFFDTFIRMTNFDAEESKLLKETILKADHDLCEYWIEENDWPTLEKYLNWSYTLKNMPGRLTKFQEITSSCKKHCKYYLNDKFLNWFGFSEEEIAENKREFISRNKTYIFEIHRRDLREFIFWCFNIETNDEFDNYDKYVSCYISSLLHLPYEKKSTIICDIIDLYAYNQIDQLALMLSEVLLFFFNEVEEERKFKNYLILSEAGLKLFRTCVVLEESPNWRSVIDLAEWFCPLEEETINKFKDKINAVDAEYFGSHDSEVKKFVIYLLDNFDADSNRVVCVNNSDFSPAIQRVLSEKLQAYLFRIMFKYSRLLEQLSPARPEADDYLEIESL